MKKILFDVKAIVIVASLLFMVIFLSPLSAQKYESKYFNNLNNDGVIIDGYDPVAFFTDNKPVKGDAQFQYTYEDAKYYFISQEHLDLFKSNPEKYKVQFGGWCAYAMGKSGDKVEIDPSTFKIINNRLYLFYNKYFNNTLKSWNKDESHLHMQADNNWQKSYHL